MARVLLKKHDVTMLGTGLLAIVVLAFKPLVDPLPWLILNASNSVPKGLYFVANHAPGIGKIAVLNLPDWTQLIANDRGYLPNTAWLLKPVLATGGTVVCRFGAYVFVDGKLVALALRTDIKGRLMPVWTGCMTLRKRQIFLLSYHRDSFDSRYFGAVESSSVIGTANPLVIFGK